MKALKVFSVPGVFGPDPTKNIRQARYRSEIKPVNLIRVMPAQGRMATMPFLHSISLSFLNPAWPVGQALKI